ncbi:hypothetical protein [Schaalia suimastitidis]|uniref:variant leucine-rich repeat-containing protein n=1 Tax=Schaalia suimastitidis TaxID=121163 RepID=UPI00040395BE|nr:hypothetical protein [Schaalia suimastitidis]
MAQNPPFDADVQQAANPTTPPQVLEAIAFRRTDLHPLIAAHPLASPALLNWLSGSPHPATQSALAARASSMGEHQQAAPASQAVPAPYGPAPTAQAVPASNGPAPQVTGVPAGSPYGTSAPPGGAPYGTGQGVSAPGSFGTSHVPLAAPQRKRNGALIAIIATVVVVALVVVAAIVGVWMKFGGSKAQADPFVIEPSPQWKNGATLVDTDIDILQIAAQGDDFVLLGHKNDERWVESYSVVDGEPVQNWSRATEDMYYASLGIWHGFVTAPEFLFDVKTGDEVLAPWPYRDAISVFVAADMAVVTTFENGFQGWASPDDTEPQWTLDIDAQEYRLEGPMQIDGVSYVLVTDSDRSVHGVLNLATGTMAKVSLPDQLTEAAWMGAKDGWGIFLEGSENGAANVAWINKDGVEVERMTNLDLAKSQAVLPLNVGNMFTIDQYRKWLQDGDASWAGAIQEAKGSDCEILEVKGVELKGQERLSFDSSYGCASYAGELTADESAIITAEGIFDLSNGEQIQKFTDAHHVEIKAPKVLVVHPTSVDPLVYVAKG